MLDLELYLATQKTAALQKVVEKANPRLLALLELTEFSEGGATYLGKKLPSHPDREELANAKRHFDSLFHRLAPSLKQLESQLIARSR